MTKNKLYRVLGIGVFVLLLILIRFFEDQLFYDPYLQFFENDYLYIDNPRREVFKLTFFTSLRFVLNSVISVFIIYLCFLDKQIVKFSCFVYAVGYVLLIIPFLYFVIKPDKADYYLFFNIRRFFIQPIMLLVLLPAFYYQKIKS
ncbi:MAG: exosortase F system-associated protein [Bacteroidetes bacterium MedPE-SWsnd-G2]|nr:MAG: exosortase F system-associated protein [Bacteroidetes bacterium MedPE-SWsnd-G2]